MFVVVVFTIVVFEVNVWLAAAELRCLLLVSTAPSDKTCTMLRMPGYSKPLTLYNRRLNITNTWLFLTVHGCVHLDIPGCRQHHYAGCWSTSWHLAAIFSNKYSPAHLLQSELQDVFTTTEVFTTTNSIYLLQLTKFSFLLLVAEPIVVVAPSC